MTLLNVCIFVYTYVDFNTCPMSMYKHVPKEYNK